MQVSHEFAASSAVFDDERLVSCAGLVPVMTLAEHLEPFVIGDRATTATGGDPVQTGGDGDQPDDHLRMHPIRTTAAVDVAFADPTAS